MKIDINNIKVMERIRKEINKIDELAEDIALNGLLHALIVMALDGGEYQLLAGLRRLNAIQSLGWTEVPVNIVAPADAEAALRIEISENEQREPFTFTEKIDFARLVEEIEREKAKLRKLEGQSLGGTIAGRGRPLDDSFQPPGPSSYEAPKSPRQQTRDIVGEKIGMSGKQYDRAKFIASNAPQEVIDELDRGERKIRPTYDELKAKEKAALPPAETLTLKNPSDNETNVISDPGLKRVQGKDKQQSTPKVTLVTRDQCDAPDKNITSAVIASKTPKPPSHPKPPMTPRLEKLQKDDEERIRKIREWEAMPLGEKVKELERQLRTEKDRADTAERELRDYKEKTHNQIVHGEGNIQLLQNQKKDLETALVTARTRINELEAKYESN